MRLRVLEPSGVVVDTVARRILAPGSHGSFGILPRHVDYAAVLEQGVLEYVPEDVATGSDGPGARERDGTSAGRIEPAYVAVDGGVLVKVGPDVVVSSPNAVASERLEEMEEAVREVFQVSEERERDARAVLYRLETDVVQRMLELEEDRA